MDEHAAPVLLRTRGVQPSSRCVSPALGAVSGTHAAAAVLQPIAPSPVTLRPSGHSPLPNMTPLPISTNPEAFPRRPDTVDATGRHWSSSDVRGGEVVASVLSQQRLELHNLFEDWCSRLKAARMEHLQSQETFITRALAAYSAGVAGSLPRNRGLPLRLDGQGELSCIPSEDDECLSAKSPNFEAMLKAVGISNTPETANPGSLEPVTTKVLPEVPLANNAKDVLERELEFLSSADNAHANLEDKFESAVGVTTEDNCHTFGGACSSFPVSRHFGDDAVIPTDYEQVVPTSARSARSSGTSASLEGRSGSVVRQSSGGVAQESYDAQDCCVAAPPPSAERVVSPPPAPTVPVPALLPKPTTKTRSLRQLEPRKKECWDVLRIDRRCATVEVLAEVASVSGLRDQCKRKDIDNLVDKGRLARVADMATAFHGEEARGLPGRVMDPAGLTSEEMMEKVASKERIEKVVGERRTSKERIVGRAASKEKKGIEVSELATRDPSSADTPCKEDGSGSGRSDGLSEATPPTDEVRAATATTQGVKASKSTPFDSVPLGSLLRDKLNSQKFQTSVTLSSTQFLEGDQLAGRFGAQQAQLRRLVHSLPFTLGCSVVIMVNAAYIGFSEEKNVQNGFAQGGATGDSNVLWDALFCMYFTCELCLRIIAEPISFVKGPHWRWNFFDGILVFNCLTEALLSDSRVLSSIDVVRILRICRMFRVLRILRVMRIFRTLRLMVSSIFISMVSLLWMFVLLFFAIYVFACFFLNAVAQYMQDMASKAGFVFAEDRDLATLMEDFGTVQRALLTLFMAISGGRDWNEIFVPLVRIGPMYGTVFFIYIFFVMFGMLNVVTSAFVDILQQVSKKDREVVIEEEMKRVNAYADGVKQIFEEADKDQSQTLSWEELVDHMQDARMKAYLSSLELDASQARALFLLLDVDESGEVAMEEFVSGCMRLKGAARSMDVNMLLYENEKLLFQFAMFREHAAEQLDTIVKFIGQWPEFEQMRAGCAADGTDSQTTISAKVDRFDRSQGNVLSDGITPTNRLDCAAQAIGRITKFNKAGLKSSNSQETVSTNARREAAKIKANRSPISAVLKSTSGASLSSCSAELY
eukprot:TRINITY_DN23958_c0_g1_i1.p1 TRINITY_DN23958_c0_g1~~TRINITY_DN23958_c0_g1_i1.p1  ORF type:complete len:1102 (+),score=197.70 TRINITY_DN23958_c0_g1_i1:299-3604(+)